MLGGALRSVGWPIGVDAGGRWIKMIQLERGTSRPKVLAAAARALPDDVQVTDDGYHDAVCAAVTDMLGAEAFVGRHVVSCLPPGLVHYKNLRLPKMPADELSGAVSWEAAQRLPFDIETVATQFFDAGEVRQGGEAREEVILIAVPTDFIERHVESLGACGLIPRALEVVPAALARLFAFEAEIDPEATAKVIVDFGHTGTRVLIQRAGRILFVKQIDIGAEKLDLAVADRLRIPLAEAAAIRIASALPDAGGGDPSIMEAERPLLHELVREVGLCLRYYSVTFRGNRPQSLMLVGGGAPESLLCSQFVEDGLQVDVVDPFEQFELDRAAGGLDALGSRSGWAVALGSSMRRDERANRHARALTGAVAPVEGNLAA